MHRRTAYRLHHPCRLPGSRVLPRQLLMHHEFVVDEFASGDVSSGLETHHFVALLHEFIGKRPAARAGTNDHDNVAVVQIEFSGHRTPM